MTTSRVYFHETDASRMIDVWAATQLLALDDVAHRRSADIASTANAIQRMISREALRFDAVRLSPPVPALSQLMATNSAAA